MLTLMRTKFSGFLAKVGMFMLIVSFSIWGIGDVVKSDFGSVVARVGDEPISATELHRESRMFARAAEAAGILNPDQHLLLRQTMRQLIEEKLTKKALHATGLSVGDGLLARDIRQAPVLQNPDGSFNEERFRMVLQQRQINEEGFLAQLKTDIENNTLVDSVSNEDLDLPKDYLTLAARAANQSRDVVLVTIPLASAKAEAAKEADLKDYYEQQKEQLYMQLEYRTLEYATIAPADLNALVAKEKGDDARDKVMQNVTDTIEDALAAGKKMPEALAAAGLHGGTHTLTHVEAGSGTDDITKAVTAAGFKMGEGETSGLKVAKGGTYYLVGVTSVTSATPKPFADVKDDVTKRLAEESRRDAVTAKAQAVSIALGKNPDWHAVLGAQQLSGQPVTGIHRDSGGNFPQPLREAIFEHKVDEAAGPLSLPNGDAVLAVVTAIHPGDNSPLDDKERKQLAEDMKQEIFAQYFNSLAQHYPVTINDKVFAKANEVPNR